MAQMQREEVESVTKETTEKKLLDEGGGSSGTQATAFKFNAQAPEFVPRSHTTAPAPQVSPISGYFYPCFHYNGGCIGGCGGSGGTGVGSQSSDWIYVGGGDPTAQHQHVHDPAAAFYITNPAVQFPANQNSSSSSKNLLSDDLRLKIVKQVLTFYLIGNYHYVMHDCMRSDIQLLSYEKFYSVSWSNCT